MNQAFEPERAILLDEPEVRSFDVQGYIPLKEALAKHFIQPHEHVLVALVGETPIALPLSRMIYHHVAQGQVGEIPWLAAFCCLCNGGAVYDARIDGVRRTFAAQGYYDMMVILADQETQSYWNHLNGMGLCGTHAGATLNRLGALTQMHAVDVLQSYPSAVLASSEAWSADEARTAQRWHDVYHAPAEPNIDGDLVATLGAPDARLSRYDMGLGLWTGYTRRYYPILSLYEKHNVIVDEVDGRTVVVTLNQPAGLPVAFYYEPQHIEVAGEKVYLGPDITFQGNVLYVDGQRINPERPDHVAIRWYGFSSAFPGCEIYGVDS